jgi:hypothetical protein
VASDVLAVDIGHAAAYGRAVGKVELVRSAVDWVVLDRRGNVEASLFKTEAHATRSSE